MKWIPNNVYYDFIKYMPIVCVDICIKYVNQVLLIKRKDEPAKGQWWIPGGRLLKGEKLQDCAKRKAIEEVGLTCQLTKDEPIYTSETVFETGPNNIPVHSINVCFLLEPDNSIKQFIKLDEHCEKMWWVRNIDPTFDLYVRNCLQYAGLKETFVSDTNPTKEHTWY